MRCKSLFNEVYHSCFHGQKCVFYASHGHFAAKFVCHIFEIRSAPFYGTVKRISRTIKCAIAFYHSHHSNLPDSFGEMCVCVFFSHKYWFLYTTYHTTGRNDTRYHAMHLYWMYKHAERELAPSTISYLFTKAFDTNKIENLPSCKQRNTKEIQFKRCCSHTDSIGRSIFVNFNFFVNPGETKTCVLPTAFCDRWLFFFSSLLGRAFSTKMLAFHGHQSDGL